MQAPTMFAPLSNANPLTVEDIPTLTVLYAQGQLYPFTEVDLPVPDQHLNDKICAVQADITTLQVGAIVNAANRLLKEGSGVNGAIQRAAGPGLLAECEPLGICPTGTAKITNGYNLPSPKVIHAVGPVYKSKQTSEPFLRSAYRSALDLAADNGCRTVAFPSISTGIYGYPGQDAAAAAISEVRAFLTGPKGSQLDKVVFCLYLHNDVVTYAHTLPIFFPPTAQDLAEYGFESVDANNENTLDGQDPMGAGGEGAANGSSSGAGKASPARRPFTRSELSRLQLDGARDEPAHGEGDNMAAEKTDAGVQTDKSAEPEASGKEM